MPTINSGTGPAGGIEKFGKLYRSCLICIGGFDKSARRTVSGLSFRFMWGD